MCFLVEVGRRSYLSSPDACTRPLNQGEEKRPSLSRQQHPPLPRTLKRIRCSGLPRTFSLHDLAPLKPHSRLDPSHGFPGLARRFARRQAQPARQAGFGSRAPGHRPRSVGGPTCQRLEELVPVSLVPGLPRLVHLLLLPGELLSACPRSLPSSRLSDLAMLTRLRPSTHLPIRDRACSTLSRDSEEEESRTLRRPTTETYVPRLSSPLRPLKAPMQTPYPLPRPRSRSTRPLQCSVSLEEAS